MTDLYQIRSLVGQLERLAEEFNTAWHTELKRDLWDFGSKSDIQLIWNAIRSLVSSTGFSYLIGQRMPKLFLWFTVHVRLFGSQNLSICRPERGRERESRMRVTGRWLVWLMVFSNRWLLSTISIPSAWKTADRFLIRCPIKNLDKSSERKQPFSFYDRSENQPERERDPRASWKRSPWRWFTGGRRKWQKKSSRPLTLLNRRYWFAAQSVGEMWIIDNNSQHDNYYRIMILMTRALLARN